MSLGTTAIIGLEGPLHVHLLKIEFEEVMQARCPRAGGKRYGR
jgi:hypothetical protein